MNYFNANLGLKTGLAFVIMRKRKFRTKRLPDDISEADMYNSEKSY